MGYAVGNVRLWHSLIWTTPRERHYVINYLFTPLEGLVEVPRDKVNGEICRVLVCFFKNIVIVDSNINS